MALSKIFAAVTTTAGLATVIAVATIGCKKKRAIDAGDETAQSQQATDGTITISVIGTNDVHGHVGRLAVFAGYVNNLRSARASGGVVVLDGGDMFQGTLESNPNEGASVVKAYNAIGYAAAAIGNHEFDFGPVGPLTIPEKPTDDPQGALRARASQATFPFLAANIVDKKTKTTPDWRNVKASTMIDVAGAKIGIIGVTTIDTPNTTISANIANLDVVDPAAAIEREATALRSKGAAAVLVTAHAGAGCKEFHNPHDIKSCVDGEIFEIARRLPTGLVDVIVAGHTHAGVAHRVNGIAIIESYAKGSAFGRADMYIRDGTLKKTVIFPPRNLCSSRKREQACDPGSYEGAAVTEDEKVAAIVTEAETAAAEERSRPLGVSAVATIRRNYRAESALGNLFVDLMLAARPSRDVAVTNGGGLRADLPKGAVTYGGLFEAMPFDNRFASVTLSAAKLAELYERNLRSKGGILSIAGVDIRARCLGGKLAAQVFRNGKALADDTMLSVVTSDFLAAGGDGAFAALKLPKGAIKFEQGETIRDAMARELGRRKTALDPKKLLDSDKPRFSFPGDRPVRCK